MNNPFLQENLVLSVSQITAYIKEILEGTFTQITIEGEISNWRPSSAGHIYFGDDDVTNKPGKISYMLQKDLLFEHKKVIDNVSLPLILKGMKKKVPKKRM